MKTIRYNTFETNSSSCHSVTICGQDKLKEFMDKKVIAFSDYEGDSDSGRTMTVPDAKFIPIEQVFTKLKTTTEMPDNDTDQKNLEFLQKSESFTLEKFSEILFNDDTISGPDEYDIDTYELRDIMENIYGETPYWNDGDTEFNPFLVGEDRPESFEGIAGPIITIIGELSC